MYLNFEDYSDMGGTLSEAEFRDIEYDAEATVNWFTFNRLKKSEWSSVLDSEELKRCMYQLIRWRQMELELLASSNGSASWGASFVKKAGITQQSNDGVSTSYNVLSSADLLAEFNGAKTKEDVVKRYLNGLVNELGRNILYRGVYPGE